jgi:peroxiredoxin
MNSYYTLLGITTTATAEEIARAYERQRQRYSPEQVAALGTDFQRIADERLAELERAFATLHDPERRRAYDQSLGTPAPRGVPQRAGLTRREVVMAAAGALVGLVLIGVVWIFAGRTAAPDLPPVATINHPAPPFTLATLEGTPINLEDYRGKIVLVNFWYTDCPPCKEETPALQAAYQRLADKGLVVLGVNVRANERTGSDGDGDIRRFMERYGVTYPVVLDRDGTAGRAFQVYVLPTSFFIDQSGDIRYARFSTLTAEDVERIVARLQQEPTAQR